MDTLYIVNNQVYIMEYDLKPPFCRQGNKYQARNIIIPLIPTNHTCYVEPFVGSGAIFWSKPKSKMTVLNDLDKSTFEGFDLISRAPVDNIPIYDKGLHTIEKIKDFYLKPPRTMVDKILHKKIVDCNGFLTKPVTDVSRIYKDSDPFFTFRHIREYKAKLHDVKLYNKDYAYIMKRFDAPDTFYFIDPPYEKSPDDFGYAESLEFDFIRLEKELRKLKGRFLMTLNDSPIVRDIFKYFHIVGWHAPTSRIQKKHRREVFISNYVLNDYI